MLVEGPTLLLSSIAGLEGRLADLAEDDLCGQGGVVWPRPAEVPLRTPLLKATHEVVLSPDPGVSDGRAGAAKDQWVSLLLALFCDIASIAVLRTTSVYTSLIDGQYGKGRGLPRSMKMNYVQSATSQALQCQVWLKVVWK